MPEMKPRSSLFLVALILALPFLGACSTLSSSGQVQTTAEAAWVVLPIDNLSSTPLAGESAASMIETSLRKRGVQQLSSYQPGQKLTLASVIGGTNDLAVATRWAREQGFVYAVTGTVHEWQYKSGTDKEPVVGLTLKLLELGSSERDDGVIWQASAAKTGWGFANLTGLAESVIVELLDQVTVTQHGFNHPPVAADTSDNPLLTLKQ